MEKCGILAGTGLEISLLAAYDVRSKLFLCLLFLYFNDGNVPLLG
jgi:hypothetical protein